MNTGMKSYGKIPFDKAVCILNKLEGESKISGEARHKTLVVHDGGKRYTLPHFRFPVRVEVKRLSALESIMFVGPCVYDQTNSAVFPAI